MRVLLASRLRPAIGKRRGNDFSRGIGIRRKFTGHGRRDLRQRLHDLAMPYQVHKTSHRIIFGGVVGNPHAVQQIDDLLVRADPNREHRLGRAGVLLAALTRPVTVAALLSAGAIAV